VLNDLLISMLQRMRDRRTSAINDFVALSVSLSVKTAERIEVLFEVETPGVPRNTVLNRVLVPSRSTTFPLVFILIRLGQIISNLT